MEEITQEPDMAPLTANDSAPIIQRKRPNIFYLGTVVLIFVAAILFFIMTLTTPVNTSPPPIASSGNPLFTPTTIPVYATPGLGDAGMAKAWLAIVAATGMLGYTIYRLVR